MPENAALSISAFPGGPACAFHGLADCKVLMICRKNLLLIDPIAIKADKVLQDIQEPFLLKIPSKNVSNWANCVFS